MARVIFALAFFVLLAWAIWAFHRARDRGSWNETGPRYESEDPDNTLFKGPG